jgi:hypothetical protein
MILIITIHQTANVKLNVQVSKNKDLNKIFFYKLGSYYGKTSTM